MINLEILQHLLGLSSDTIITLELGFVFFFNLPARPIKAIGRIEGLRTLCLGRLEYCERSTVVRDHTAFLIPLMMEARGLKTLQLDLPVSLPCHPDLVSGTPFPDLELHAESLNPDVMLGICNALKPSLKFLTFRGSVTFRVLVRESFVHRLLPLCETLRESLEALSVEDIRFLRPTLHLSFPKLRVLVIPWTNQALSLLNLNMLAPTKILAIDPFSLTVGGKSDTFTVEGLSSLPQLEKLVLLRANQRDRSSAVFLAACQARNINCIFIEHNDLSQIMDLCE